MEGTRSIQPRLPLGHIPTNTVPVFNDHDHQPSSPFDICSEASILSPPSDVKPSYAIHPPKVNCAINPPTIAPYAVAPTPITTTSTSIQRPVMAAQYRRQSSFTHSASQNTEPMLEVGDTVEVPGGMTGTVRYIGSVRGKNGEFVGVELGEFDAPRGKNDGDVDGIRYFETAIPGAGIFLPSARAIRLNPPRSVSGANGNGNGSAYGAPPSTPVTRKIAGHADTPTVGVGMSLFSQSVGPGTAHPFSQSVGVGAKPPRAGAASPQAKQLKSRPSLPRPASPTRKPSAQAPPLNSRPSVGAFRTPASPFSSRTTKPATPLPGRVQSRAASRAAEHRAEDTIPPSLGGSTSGNMNLNLSRPSIGGRGLSSNITNSEELKRLHSQLSSQASTIQDLESQIVAFQAQSQSQSHKPASRPSDAPEVATLRAQLREKNDKILALTADFDAHRHDFKDTIDALEAASAETERVYSKRIKELEAEVEELVAGREEAKTLLEQLEAENEGFKGQIEELQTQREEMEGVVEQFTHLEGMVQELEEGLDDARRAQSEATLRCEELEGEVERGRAELEQVQLREGAANNTSASTAAAQHQQHGHADADNTKELELEAQLKTHIQTLTAKNTEINGLKLLLQNLSSSTPAAQTLAAADTAKELERLRAENARLRSAQPTTPGSSPRSASRRDINGLAGATTTALRPFPRDAASLASLLSTDSSTDLTATLWCEICEAAGHDVLSCRNVLDYDGQHGRQPDHLGPGSGAQGLSLEDEFHDAQDDGEDVKEGGEEEERRVGDEGEDEQGDGDGGLMREEEQKAEEWDEEEEEDDEEHTPWVDLSSLSKNRTGHDPFLSSPPVTPAQVQPYFSSSTPSTAANSSTLPTHPSQQPQQPPTQPANKAVEVPIAIPGETGPAPGKRTQQIDLDKWCAFCERDGHDSVDCPFEEEL